MSQKEFVSVVPDCNILTTKEIVDMMKYYSDVLTTPLPFIQAQRFGSTLRCYRFARDGALSFPGDQVGIKVRNYCIYVTTSKKVWLHGVQLYGSEKGKCKVDVKIVKDGSFLVKQSGTYASQKCEVNEFHRTDCFDMLFDHPVVLGSGKEYQIISNIYGPLTAYLNTCNTFGSRTGEITEVKCAGVDFKFRGEYGSACWSDSREQFPALIFTL